MCGIAGFVGLDDEPLLRAMCASLTHRGPDDSGFFIAPGVGLSMRRLSIIDLQTGRQPISNEDGSIHVVLNGEIYNYEELTRRLEQRGHVFKTASDTETIVHLYEDYGLDFAQHLRGMFAIALWDAKRKRLVLVRDRIGEKPLYFTHAGNELLFGSEPKAILQRNIPRRVNAQAVCEFLAAGYVPAPRTFYDSMNKLPPGHLLVHDAAGVNIRAYWRRGEQCTRSDLSFRAASDGLIEMLTDTVKLCLKSDVEVGAFLSGGVDSSVIVALMCEHKARVQTFAVGYGGKATGFNELHHAKRVAEQLGTRHHELILDAQSTIELLPRILWSYDEPHGEPSSTLVYRLCEFTRQQVSVALGGTGGDEIFYGYPRHKGIRLLQYYKLFPRILREQLVERVVLKWPESTRGSRFAKRAKRFVEGCDKPPEIAYLGWVSLLHRDVRAALLSEETRAAADDPAGDGFLQAYLVGGDDRDLLARAADLDVGAYLPEYQLAYMDRMSMAHGLEARSPLCDYKLVDYVTSLPASYRLRRTHSKHIFKSIARRWVPKAIAERKKVGFDSPIGQWFKDELRGFMLEFLSRDNVERSGVLSYEGVSRVLGDHLSGRRDYSLQLWSILAIEAWHRMYIEDRITDGRDYSLSDLRGASICPQPRPAANEKAHPSACSEASGGKAEAPRPLVDGDWNRKKLWDAAPRLIRRAIGPVLGRMPATWLLGRRFRRQLAFIEESQWWNEHRIGEYHLQRLRHLCRLAYERAPFYRRRLDDAGLRGGSLRSIEELRLLPTIAADDVRRHLDEMCVVPTDAAGVDLISTGGTGGAPLSLYIGNDRSVIEYAFLSASWRRAGYCLDTPLAVFRGHVVPKNRSGLRHEYDPLLRHHYYSSFHLTDENMRRYLEHLRSIGPCYLHVYPSVVFMLARFLRRSGLDAPGNVRGIIAESEIVYPEQRDLVEKVWACRYFSCYGHSEKLVLATECEHSADYHVWPTYGYFELLDDDGNSVNTPGQRGEIVGTGFINQVMPFIRYRTGDHATYVANRCVACGREHTIIRDIRGHRVQEMLVAADGSALPWTALNMHDETFARVRQFQFAQAVAGRAILRVVPAEGFGQADMQRIYQSLDRKLRNRIEFSIDLVESIELSSRGKAIYVDQRIPRVPPADT